MTRVLVVEDHTLFRESLVKTVNGEAGFEVAGEAGRGDDALALAARLRPDLVLLDIQLPGGDGLEVAEKLRSASPGSRVLFLTMHDDDTSVRQAVTLGAAGYVPKTASTDELIAALRAVAAGQSFLSPSIARRVMQMASGKTPAGPLTQRELEILRLLATGARPAEVAGKLFLSLKTVKNHLTHIYDKLGVETAAQAVAAAYRTRLVPTDGSR